MKELSNGNPETHVSIIETNYTIDELQIKIWH